jgi:hypothetical protein
VKIAKRRKDVFMTDQKGQRQMQLSSPEGVQELEDPCLGDVTGGTQPPATIDWSHPFDKGTAPPAGTNGMSKVFHENLEGRTLTHPEVNEFLLTDKLTYGTMDHFNKVLGKGTFVYR